MRSAAIALAFSVAALLFTPGAALGGEFSATVANGAITITYTPSGDCNDIVLVQTVKVTASQEDGNDSMVIDPSELDNKLKHLKDDLVNGVTVDHVFCEKDEYYNGYDQPQDIGTPGYQSGSTKTDATMNDRPNLPVPVKGKPKVTAEFEVCAYCNDSGALDECMTWTYMNSVANGASIMVTGGTGAGNATTPSQGHQDAVERFRTNHTDDNGTPQDPNDDTPRCPEKEAADAEGNDANPARIPPVGQSEFKAVPALFPANRLLIGLLLAGFAARRLRRRRAGGRASSARRRRHSPLVLPLAWLVGLSTLAVPGEGSEARAAQSCVPFPSIVAANDSEYANYQIKFTWIGQQLKINRTFGVAGSATTFTTSDFSPCLLPADRYRNDDLAAPETVTLSAAEISEFIQKLEERPELQTQETQPGRVLSWQILRPVAGGNTEVFEHLSTSTGTRTVLLLLLGSLDPGQPSIEEAIIRTKRIYVGDLE